MKKPLFFGLSLLLTISLTACQSPVPSAGKTDLEEVTLVLDYLPNTNHTGFYVAQEKGYFAEEGLQLNIVEPADATTTTLIAAGKGDFGISYQEDVTYALAAEEALPIQAIATIIQHNTSGFATYAPKNITRPQKFNGKIYSGWGAPSEEAVIEAVMKADGGDFSTLNIVTSSGGGYAALKDNIDISWFFWGWDGIAAEREGLPLHYMELRQFDERLDYYTPVIIATRDTLEHKSDLTERFLRATSKGYAYAIENPEASARILAESNPEYDVDMLIASQEYLSEKYSEDSPRWGEMKDSVWENYTAFMMEYGLISESIPADTCYTNQFLPE